MSTDAEHIRWTADRLVEVYGEPRNVDFVQRLRKIAEDLENSPAAAAVRGRYPRGQNGQHDRMLATQFLDAIVDERHRAHDKHGATSMEQAPLLAHKRASVLTEEAVECARALNDHEHGEIVLRENLHEVGQRISGLPVDGIAQVGPIVDPLDKELIQTAAMAYTWWANRRGDQLAPPVQKPIRGGRTQTIPVFIDGSPHIGVIDPVTGEVHVHTVVEPWGTALHDAAVGDEIEVRIPPIPPVPVRKSADIQFLEASIVPGPPDPSKGIYPILSVRDETPTDDPDGGRRGD